MAYRKVHKTLCICLSTVCDRNNTNEGLLQTGGGQLRKCRPDARKTKSDRRKQGQPKVRLRWFPSPCVRKQNQSNQGKKSTLRPRKWGKHKIKSSLAIFRTIVMIGFKASSYRSCQYSIGWSQKVSLTHVTCHCVKTPSSQTLRGSANQGTLHHITLCDRVISYAFD